MTVTVNPWLTGAKIVELRLGIDAVGYGTRSSLDRRAYIGTSPDEQWAGEVLLATVGTTAAHPLRAALNALDGRVVPFAMPLTSGFASQSVSLSGTLAAATTRQSDSISLTATAGTVVKAGTLIALGNITDDAYQVVEVLQDFTTGTGVTVLIAPRIRTVLASGTVATLGTVSGRFMLASDDVVVHREYDRATCTIAVAEYV